MGAPRSMAMTAVAGALAIWLSVAAAVVVADRRTGFYRLRPARAQRDVAQLVEL